MQKSSRSEAARQSQMNELKTKFLQLHELEGVLEEIFELENQRTHKLPRRMQDTPKTTYHDDSPTIISDDHV